MPRCSPGETRTAGAFEVTGTGAAFVAVLVAPVILITCPGQQPTAAVLLASALAAARGLSWRYRRLYRS
ncbi:hypothetical protein GCM10020000_02110 [Streptomyces olivoverticillatus]